VIENTNTYGIVLTGVSNFCTVADNNSVWQLSYSATALSGIATNVTVAPWVAIATSAPTPVLASGITSLNFTNLSFTIPANTRYRFVLRNTGPGSTRYSGSGTPITPNTHSNAGVNLLCGDVQINGFNVGYAGTGNFLTINPRYFTGGISFQPAIPCTDPPTAGTISTPTTFVCQGSPFTLSLDGTSLGLGLIYQWQISTNNTSWTNITGATATSLTTTQSSANYYRCVVTCGTAVQTPSIFINTPSSAGGTFTINNNLPTAGTNFNSFNAAYDYIKCGIGGPVVFNVDPNSGPYTEQLIMTPITGTSPVNTVTFNGNGRTLQFLSTNTNERAVIKLNGADFIRFNNLVVSPLASTAAEYGFGVQLINNADSNIISNCTININDLSLNGNTQYAGIVVSASNTSATTAGSTLSDGNIFRNNTINGGFYGITLVGSNTEANRNNSILKNTFNDYHTYAVYISGTFNTLVDSNFITRPTRINFGSTSYGIFMTGLNTVANISRNTITNPFGGAPNTGLTFNGIAFNGVDALPSVENKVYNNQFYGMNGTGEINAINNTGSDNAWYHHNTILIDGEQGSALSRGFYQTTTAGGIRFENNIVMVNRNGSGTKYALYHNAIGSDITSDRNILFMNSPGGNQNIGFYDGLARTTLADWRAVSLDDTTSVNRNPLFTDIFGGNLRPNSPLIDNLGFALNYNDDIIGAPRSATTPDIGAYEFTPSPCTTPPVSGNTLVAPTSVCENTPINIGLSGNSVGLGQTYIWQVANNPAGPFSDIGNALNYPDSIIIATETQYYRVAVICGASTTFSEPILLTVFPALPAGTYTINPAQPTGGSNYASFADVVAALSCGINGPVVFDVDPASGPYNEQVILNPIAGTSDVNTITFNGNGRTIGYLSTNTNERAVIKLNGADHIIFNNLVVKPSADSAATGFGYGFHLTNNADSNVISNCTININDLALTSVNYAGIVISANASATGTGATLSDANIITGNTINGGYYGITCVGSNTEANRFNTFSNNIINDFSAYGFYAQGNFYTTVDSNVFARPNRTGINATSGGIIFTGLSTLINVSRNTITNPFGGSPTVQTTFNGITLNAVDALAGLENKIYNNKIYGFNGNGEQNGILNTGSDNAWYFHNTILMDGDLGTSNFLTRGFYQTTQAGGIRFQNNIVSITRSGDGAKYAVYHNVLTSEIQSDNNVFYLNSVGGTQNVGFYNAAAQPTLLNWQTASTDDALSRVNNPLFADLLTGDLKPTSALIDNVGVDVGVLADLINVPRSTLSPDAGAYEFTPGPCTEPPTPGQSIANPSIVCVNTNVALSLTRFSVGLTQTYQWQTAPAATGPFTNIGNVLNNPDTTIVSSITQYYRVAVICGASTAFSEPALVTVNPALPTGTYSINRNQPTAGSNYNSFADVKQALECGIAGPVVFNVVAGSGPYEEQFILGAINGTSAINTITFNGNADTIRFSSNNTTNRSVIKLRNTDHVTFNNFVVDARGAGSFGIGLHFLNNADSNTIKNCTILINNTAPGFNTSYLGVLINGVDNQVAAGTNPFCDGNTIDSNTIIGGAYSICVAGSTTTLNENTKINNNKLIDFATYGIFLTGGSKTMISYNDISRPSRVSGNALSGIILNSKSIETIISKNKIHDLFAGEPTSVSTMNGINFSGADGEIGKANLVVNNLIYSNSSEGIQYGIANNSSDYMKAYHNTIVLQDERQSGNSPTYGFYQTTDATGIEFKNNMVYILRSGIGNKFGMYFNSSNSNISSNNNNFFLPSANSFVGFLNGNQTTINDWRAASSQDANSFSVDPIFANANGANFTPLFPGIDNAGQALGVTDDINNVTRNATTPDIGAFEFTSPACTAPPAVGNATADPNSGICIETEVDLSINGYVYGGGQTYQWEYSPTNAAPWLPLGGSRLFPDTTILASTSNYYRCLVTCNGQTSISGSVQVTLNPAFLAGTYTINRNIPASITNFTSFVSAVAALECGITGPVFFDVAPDTYVEQVRMRKVPGSSPINRVTFRSETGNPTSVVLTWDNLDPAANYVLKLDSASYITYKNMTITTSNALTGRVVELANLAGYDSIVGCRIIMPITDVTTNVVTGIFANNLRGKFNVFKGNLIEGGAFGIHLRGIANGNYTQDHVIDSNTIEQNFVNGIFVEFAARLAVTRNVISMAAPRANNTYGIISNNSDSAYNYSGNKININSISGGTAYGMSFNNCDAGVTRRAKISGNLITGENNNCTLYGLYQSGSVYNSTINNVVSITTTGANAYASFLTGGGGVKFHNNSIMNSSLVTGANNHAGYFGNSAGQFPATNIQNNIFTHQGDGRAMYVANASGIFSNYNMFHTNGTNLIQLGFNQNFATLNDWITNVYWDIHSISYAPAFSNTTTLLPDLANPNVWAMHGRGTQIEGNDFDFNNDPRPTTFTTGVPDLGAYEFLPTSEPTILNPVPLTPVAGTSQYFMYGTDTVSMITWDATAPVPASVTLRRYSGILPTGLSAGQESMYFFTKLEVPAQGAYKYDFKQFYIDPWRGFIPTEQEIKLGKTNATDQWDVINSSKVELLDNYITADTALVHIDRYTGLRGNAALNPVPPYVTVVDSSNRGTRFWVPYGHHYSFSGNSQNMWLYLSAQTAATVEVKVNGTNWKRVYNVAANSAIVSDIMPKFGFIDARITDEGLFERGISITSDVPIEAFAHIYDGATSGATMLMPVGVYGYDYVSLNTRQFYPSGGAGSFSWFAMISDRDSTMIEITPTVTTRSGRPAGVPFTVMLMKGQVYNVMGTQVASGGGSDLTGSRVRAIANASGKCYPFAMFSGSSRTAICYFSNGDNFIQQVFPSQAWGKRYASFATANSQSNTNYNSNLFRILVKDTTTEVRINGVLQSRATLNPLGKYYEQFTASGNGAASAVLIEADKPVLVAQYMVSTSANQCAGVTATGDGDPEMIYISPTEQGIKKAVFYSTDRSAIRNSYVNIVIPTNGISSLVIDGVSTFTNVFAHPFLPGYSCVRQNFGVGAGQHTVSSDSAFTAITYGLGSVESYGYNAGTLVKNLNSVPSITNTLGTDSISNYTCVNAPFRFNILITSKPQVLTWGLSQVANLTPNADVVQVNPVILDSTLINGRWYYRYNLPADYFFTQPGSYIIPIQIKDTVSIEGCENTQEITLEVTVLPAPIADFTTNFSGCLGSIATLTGSGSTIGGATVSGWNWNFGNGNNATGQTTTYTYPAAGTFPITLTMISTDGCLADTTKNIVVNQAPPVELLEDSITICVNETATFQVQNPQPNITYNWYTTSTGGASVNTGTTYSIPNVTSNVEFWVEGTTADGCLSDRRRVEAVVLADIPNPVVRVDSIGADQLRFAWDAVPGAVSYEVSTDNAATWITPSSGPIGLTHTVTGLLPLQSVTLIVRAIGSNDCQKSESTPITEKTLPGQIFIPNAFSPNGDGLNDVFLVYGFTIEKMQFAVYNQWGEKIFESFNQSIGWDGTFKGTTQPSGVYMYVCKMTLRDGKVVVRKGSINLIR
jgi:gliding motility-associated-like protein